MSDERTPGVEFSADLSAAATNLTAAKQLLADTNIFGAVEDAELDALAPKLTPLSFSAGETVLQQGEISDGIYIIVSGKVQIVDDRQANRPIILATLSRGQTLGERSIFTGEPVARLVQAAEDLQMLRLDTAEVEDLLSREPELRERIKARIRHDAEFTFLRSLNLLSGLSRRDTEKLLSAVETIELAEGDFLFHEGDAPDGAYIVRSGEIEVVQESAGGSVISTLKPGALLGELALHLNRPRTAGSRAGVDSVLLRLKRDDYLWVTQKSAFGKLVEKQTAQFLLHSEFLSYRADTREGRNVILQMLHEDRGVEKFWQRAAQEKQRPEQTLQNLALAAGMDYLVPTPNLLLDPDLMRQIPAQYLLANQVLPAFMEGDKVEVLVGTPFLGTLPEELSRMLQSKLSLRITEPGFLAKLIEHSTTGNGGIAGSLTGLDEDESWEDLESIEDLKDQAQAAPIIKLVNSIFTEAINRKASDIHIDPYEEGVEVRYRIDGILHLVSTAPRRYQAAIVSRIKIMANLDIAERRIPQDGRIALRLEAKSFDLRVATVPTVFGEGVVMRILDKSSVQVAIESVGLTPEMLVTWKEAISKPNGVVLVTGPTGSGKTTTLYASLNHIKSPEVKIITAEDPVEYQLHGIKQIQVNAKVNLTFATALRSMLRLDPDIIMVGEIRDFETAEIAVQAALTGHLVFSTLHTNDAPTSITRLVEMGIAPYLVASALNAALAQRLVRKLCVACREQNDEGKWQAVGCTQCGGTGYKGRLGVYELMVINERLRELIVQGKDASVIAAEARQMGMLSLLDDANEKARLGLTTEAEVRRVAG